MKTLVTFMLIGLVGVSYTIHNFIINLIEDAEMAAWLIFTIIAVVGGFIPFVLFILGALALIRRAER